MPVDEAAAGAARAEEVIRVGDHTYVLAVASRADERRRVLKHGETFAVLDRYGDILGVGLGDHGLFHAGTRHLSRLDVRIDGLRPLLLSSSLEDENLVLAVDLTNPDLSVKDTIAVPRGTVHILRTALVWDGMLYQRLVLHNFGLGAVALHLGARVEADFVDIFEVRGVVRAKRGRLQPQRAQDGLIVAEYDGLDNVRRLTHIACTPAPDRITPGTLEMNVRLAPGESRAIELRIDCGEHAEGPPPMSYDEALEEAHQRVRKLRARECGITTPNHRFNEWVDRSRADLHLMLTLTKYGPYPYAGVPWFSTPFGRDGIITALQMLWLESETAKGVLSFLAGTQADTLDPAVDAEPGKIVHEVRRGEMAATGEVPYRRYYGSVDSTPLFLLLAGRYLRTTGDMLFIRSLWPNIRRALEWIERYGDRDGDGFVEYQSGAANGLLNQGWKDSIDSVFDEQGALAQPPIALCEVQGYTYAARRSVAEIAGALGHTEIADQQARRAEALRDRFAEMFWDDKLGLFVLALDAQKRPCRVASSNAGQCLFTEIAQENHARAVARAMMGPAFFSGWGIRTIAEGQARYNPMSYHDGSIWPHDTALIALGMARYGGQGAAAQLLGAMLDVALCMELERLPELFCGFTRRRGEGPVRYPVACSPQAWAAGTVFLMLQACLGLTVRGDKREVHLRSPALPDTIEAVRLSGLRVGPASVDLELRRHGGEVGVNVLRRDPTVRVILTS